MLKEYIKSMFKFLRGQEIRLWHLEQSFELFVDYYKINRKVLIFYLKLERDNFI